VHRANDISSCALVCRQWLDIVNNHRSIETSISYNDKRKPHNQLLRRFKNTRFDDSAAMALTTDEFKNLCQQSKEVWFSNCKFPNLDALKARILACGDLVRLVIDDPYWDDSETLPVNIGADEECGSKSLDQKIETLVFLSEGVPELQLFEMIHNSSIDVANMELKMRVDYDGRDDTELRSVVPFLKKHYQEKLRKLVVNRDLLLELLDGFSRLKLKTLEINYDLDEQRICDFISSQPSITDLNAVYVDCDVLQYAFRNLPLLNFLELNCDSFEDLNVLLENSQHLRTLTCLKIEFDMLGNENEIHGCDLTFIAKIPNLRSFYCQFDKPPLFVKLAPIENPMPLMKEFYLSVYYSGAEIDAESMWNIFNKMPNLEKITLHEETAKV
jgi:hypothetical protein